LQVIDQVRHDDDDADDADDDDDDDNNDGDDYEIMIEQLLTICLKERLEGQSLQPHLLQTFLPHSHDKSLNWELQPSSVRKPLRM
jgi:hypothetical protein